MTFAPVIVGGWSARWSTMANHGQIPKFPLCLLVNHGHFHWSQEARKKRQELDLDYRLGRHVPRHAAVPICPASGIIFSEEK